MISEGQLLLLLPQLLLLLLDPLLLVVECCYLGLLLLLLTVVGLSGWLLFGVGDRGRERPLTLQVVGQALHVGGSAMILFGAQLKEVTEFRLAKCF